jgi:hypothetical protein
MGISIIRICSKLTYGVLCLWDVIKVSFAKLVFYYVLSVIDCGGEAIFTKAGCLKFINLGCFQPICNSFLDGLWFYTQVRHEY